MIPDNSVLVERIDSVRTDIRRMENKIDNFSGTYITRSEFLPVKLIAFGFVACVLVAFMGLLLISIGWKG